jgi:plasmid stabilization system protein ParE
VGRSDPSDSFFPVKPVILRPAAEADLAAAREWYSLQRPGLGDHFLDAATEAAHFIAEHPEAYQVLHRDVRRAPLRHFPYGLLFRVYPNVIVVVAVFHARRDPKIWRQRLALDDG